VIGENKTFLGEEELLKSRGVQLIVAQDETCYNLMQEFIKRHPEEWNEDIGEE
jgi:cytosine/creatinine deaminase